VKVAQHSVSLLFGLLFTISAYSQSGMEFKEFSLKLQPYFDDELIADLEAAMPKGAQYRVWGWDVGDFTGDGVPDVTFSVNVLGQRKRESTVYLFVDNFGYLVNVGNFQLAYIDLPLEIGVLVRDTIAYVTQKKKSDYWTIRGYTYRSGSMVQVDEFISNKVEHFGHESYRNFSTLQTKERFLDEEGLEEFAVEYTTVPCYSRGRQVYAGFVSDVITNSIRNVHEGAFYWTGPADASFTARTVYDDDNLYVWIKVVDSNVVTGWCDTCTADRLEIWLDTTPAEDLGGSRYVMSVKKRELTVRESTDSGLYAIAVKIGDFAEIRPSVKIRTTDELDAVQESAVDQVRVVTAQRSDGYIVKIRVPWVLLGYARVPIEEKILTELGCTIALYDIDNEFRPEEVSVISTSAIKPLNPTTYGAIRFIPESTWYGETNNIYVDAVINTLRELGF